MLDFVDPKTFEFHKVLIGLLSLHGRRHDGETMAVEMAQRIDRVTSDNQFLAMGISDSGGNVKSAVKQVLHTYEELLEKQRQQCLSLYAAGGHDRQPRAGGDADDALENSDGEEESDSEEADDDDDANDVGADVERHRSASCCAHTFHLVSKGLRNVVGVAEVCGKVDKIIASTRNSTLCQQRLEGLQRAAKDDVLCLISPSKTRWFVCLACV